LLAVALASSGAFAGSARVSPYMHTLTAAHVPLSVSTAQVPRISMLPKTQHLKLALSLPLRNEDALNDLLQQLQDPNSPNFHHYLSGEEFTARFGPTQADYDEVVSWAQAKGFTVTDMPSNRRLVDIDGSVDTVNQAFNVNMGAYAHPTDARQFFAPDREPTVDLPVPLISIAGLNNFTPPSTHLKQGNLAQVAAAGVRTTGSGPSGQFLPSDMRVAYYGNGPLTGAGQSIGIFSFDGYKTSDVTLFYSSTGMSSSVPINNVLVSGFNGACSSPCDDGEQILDIVNAIGMAPGISQVLFYEGNLAADIMNKMVTDNKAKILSCSWFGNDFDNPTDDPIYQQMAAQGQTFVNATGDYGAYNNQAWGAPSADPYVLQVGGTDLTTNGAGGSWASETGWADSGGGFYSGAGESTPSYQQLAGVITTANKASSTYRNDPDISAEANFDNPTVSNGVLQSGYGGTSFAAPRWAGYLALVNQKSIANGHGVVGFVNPALYNIALGVNHAIDFHDVTSGNNKPSKGSGSGFNAVAGYDLVTGWGSPTVALVDALAGTGDAPDFALAVSPNPLNITTTTSGTATVTITQINGFSNPVNLAISGLPAGATASFSPASAMTSSVLTVNTGPAPAGTYNLTITGSSTALVHTAVLALTVVVPAQNFSIAVSSSTLTIARGASGTETVTVSGVNGFNGNVSLAAAGLPAGVTATFNPASTTSSSTLTLAASSTATTGTVTVTVTGVSGSTTHSTTLSLTVTGTSSNYLQNGVPVTGLAAAKDAQLMYMLVIPTDTPVTNLKFTISGGTGDADLYVKYGATPTLTSYDCRPYVSGNSETCTIGNGVQGTYYVMLNAYAAFSGVTLTASYSVGQSSALTNGVPLTGLSGSTGTLSGAYTLAVPAGKTSVSIKISGGTGDADMYVKLNAAPTLTTYDCRPYVSGNGETCTFTPPAGGGTYYVKLNAYTTYSGVSLTGSYSP
jgi:xanthomonalisin